MRTLRASEIGVYLYCQRAWWYQRQGLASANIEALAVGVEFHTHHSRAALASGCLRYFAVALILLAAALSAAYLVGRLI